MPDALYLYDQMVQQHQCFWEVVREPFMARELNRKQVRDVIRLGLQEAGGSYKALLGLFQIDDEDYLKFMDFLRHHRLKPKKVEARHYHAA